MEGWYFIATTTAERTETTYDKEAYVKKMQERRKDLADKLESGLKELYASDKYADYLKTMSKFPRYSSRNVMLIHMQMPGATRVAGASKWKSDFKRHPKKGEKAIYIYAPVKKDKEPETKMFEKIDPETGAPMLDSNGKIIMEEMTALDLSRMRYRPAPVFDVSQTDGKPLPEIVSPLNGDVERYEALLDALKAVSALPIEFEKMPDSQDGYCRYGEKIGIREGMSERQTVAAIVHEIAHERMHDKEKIPDGEAQKSRAVRELEAESVAFAICDKYGVNSGDNSFGYLATWAGHDPEMKQLKASLDTIQKEVGSLSRELDVHYAAALKNRGLEAEQPQEREDEMKMANTKGIDALCAKARKYIKENGLFLAFSVNDIKDYQSLRRAAQDVEARNSAHPTAGRNHIKFMYDLLRQAEPFQNEQPLAEQEKVAEAATQPPAPLDMGIKEYSLGFGYTGSVNSPDGIEVWNWADEKPDGSYTIVANITTWREVTFIDENMPDSIKDEIFEKANTAVMQDEDRSECKFVPAANLPDGWRWQQWDDGSGSLQSPDDESVVSYDLSTSEYKYKGDWNFMDGYPRETESFASFKDSMEKRVSIDRGIDVAALSAEQPQTAQEIAEAPAPEPEPEPTMSTFPLYKDNLSDAFDRGETETYHKSRQLNFLCRDTIDKTIEEHRKSIPDAPAGVCTYDMKAAVWSVISECGRDRAEWVLASNINGASSDGRFSRETKEWAKNTGAPERHDYHIQTHKAVLDGFARRFRESEKEKPPMSFLYAQAQQKKKAADAQKSGGDIEQSGHKKSEER